MLREAFDHLAHRLREECLERYRDRLVSVVLFGSVARGTMRPDSDMDILLVVEPLPQGRTARVREFEDIDRALEADLELARRSGIQTLLAPVFKTRDEVGQGSPLFLDMTIEARILFDREGFFDHYLQDLRARMKALGSVRKELGGGYYWLLKPDWKPGETITL
jgi:predicted nucleotidyltransferase